MNPLLVGQPAATPKLVAYTALTGIGLLAAVVLGEIAVVGLAAPFAFVLMIGLLSSVPALPTVITEIDEHRII